MRLENSIRDHLNKIAIRAMVVLDPLRVVITNYPETVEWLNIENNPEDPESGLRKIPFGREIFIEQEDFMELPPPKYFRLSPGNMVRLKGAYIIQCDEVVRDENGKISHLNCSYFSNSKSGEDQSGLKVKTTIHWVEKTHASTAEIRLYDKLFTVPNPASSEEDFRNLINPNSLELIPNAVTEPALKDAHFDMRYQFIRKGYFCLDKDSRPDRLVFNRTVTLKDGWSKS